MIFYRYSSSLSQKDKLNLSTYSMIKETPKGYWLDVKKWVSKTSKKRFAYPTKEEALVNFIKRTQRRLKILDEQRYNCQTILTVARAKKTLGDY